MIRVIRGVMTLEEVEAWGGEDTRKATEKALTDRALLTRWNLKDEVDELNAEVIAEAKVG